MPDVSALPELSFDDFLTYDELTRFLESLAEARPELCRLSSLGRSREGRHLYLLTVTNRATGEGEAKPAYLVHGNIHAAEVAGTHAALWSARRLLEDAGDASSPRHAAVRDLLDRTAFYLVPRINPDGAEAVVGSNAQLRSRTDRSRREPNTLYQADLDGDGRILSMRVRHPDGEWAADPLDPRLLVRRRAGSPGPFYRLFPEGTIHEWDGGETIRVEGRSFDWNRNWSCNWRPEPEQWGAGDHPFSEEEMRELALFLSSHRNLYAVLGYHTGTNAVLRPPSTGSRADLDAEDDAVMEDLSRVAARLTGFPVVPVVEYHTARGRDINLYGHFHDFGYQHLGLYVFEFELGILLNSAGIAAEEFFSSRTEEEMAALERRLMAWHDRVEPGSPLYVPWKPFHHPQLGEVELGGFLHRYRYNPSLRELKRIAEATYAFTLEHASRHPWVRIEEARAEAVGPGVLRVRARIANRGALPTHVSNRGKGLRRLEPPRVEFLPAPGVELLSARGHLGLGHLEALRGGALCEWFVRTTGPASGKAVCTIRAHGGAGGDAETSVLLP